MKKALKTYSKEWKNWMKQNKKIDFWKGSAIAITLFYLAFFILPLGSMLLRSFYNPETGKLTWENFSAFFGKEYYYTTIFNSFRVTIVVTLLTLLIGIPLAYFTSVYEVKGEKLLNIVIVISSMSAPFIGAYSWILLLGRNGFITNLFKKYFGIQIPDIYGFNGILLVLTLQLFPLVYLYVKGALESIDNTLLEASESLGIRGKERLFKVILPLIKPTIYASAILVFMRAFADFGTPMLIGEGYRTFPRLIFDEFVGEMGGDEGFAAAISVIAIILTSVIFLVQRYLSNRKQFEISAMFPIQKKKLKGFKNGVMHGFIYFVAFVALLPQLYLFYTSFLKTSGLIFVKGFSLDSYRMAFSRLGSSIQNTLLMPGIALIVLIVLATIISYLVVRKKGVFSSVLDTITMIPYIIPGAVIGIALLSFFSKKPFVLTGTYLIMIIALIVRRLPYTIRSSVAMLTQIPVSTEEASISLGASNFKTFFGITVPMMAPGILSGAILSWVTMISELSTAIILYTGRTQTMTVAIYTQVIRGNYGVAASLSAILTALTVISLVIARKISGNESLSM